MDSHLTSAIRAAREAGDFIMTQYGNVDITLKEDMSPVTEADMGAHMRLMESLRETGIPILSEESIDQSHIPFPYPDTLWIIDPLDGTRDFIEETGDFSVMIGLLHKGRPVLGVVYAPATRALYYAQINQGAFVEHDGVTTRLSVSTHVSPHLRSFKSRHHYTPFMEEVAQKLLVTEEILRGSVGVKAGLLGEKVSDFFFYTGALGAWDVCGPELIVTEAGGRVTDLEGNLISYNEQNHRLTRGIVLSNGFCHDNILKVIQSTSLSHSI
ncbi:MAG: 3'(2'),5'-bisphosphate nucleotidase CysQ [Minisyncoccia bacterium]